jgi:hypothetical protein
MERIEVIAYSGASGEEEPRAVILGPERLEIAEITRRWREPDGRYFTVLTTDGRKLALFCAHPELEWFLAPSRRD